MNWLLLVVLAILVGNALIGSKVGFIRTVFSLCSMIVAIVLTIWISPTVNDLIKGNDKIYNTITSKVEKMVPFEKEESKIMEGLHLPKSIKESLLESNKLEKTKAPFREYAVEYLTNTFIKALSFILTFVVILIILWTLCFALNLISKLPVLNQINKMAGLVAGLVHGLVVVWLFFILLTVFGSNEFGQKALQMIGDSEILSIIYNNNLLLKFITSATKLLF